MNISENKEFTASEKWRLIGHLLFSAGTLCLSISTLLKLAQDGELPEASAAGRSSVLVPSARDQAHDFFRRS